MVTKEEELKLAAVAVTDQRETTELATASAQAERAALQFRLDGQSSCRNPDRSQNTERIEFTPLE